jgi:hypothetical protein
MESTNPRARVEPSWAPPPPVTPAERDPQQQADHEADFDATLGNLVEHFATLPPATYGEPVAESVQPVAAPEARPERRWIVPVAALAAAVVGGVVTLAILTGPQQLWASITGDSPAAKTPATVKVSSAAPAAAPTPAPSAAATSAPKTPKAEPLAAPAVIALPAKTATNETAAAKAGDGDAAPVEKAKAEPLAAPKKKKVTAKKVAKKKASKTKPAKKKAAKSKRSKTHKTVHPRKLRKRRQHKKKSTPPKAGDWKDPYA